MRLALITDTHFGVRNDNSLFYPYFAKFLKNIFFPALNYYGVERVVHLGDLTDRRKYLNFQTLDFMRKAFLNPLKKYPMDIIIGNHDTFFKSTNNLNSPSLLLQDYENITIYKEPTHVTIPDSKNTQILFLPWITSENRDETLQMISESNAKYVMGHLELTGYVMYPGSICHAGTDPNILSKFDTVFSGHFHTKNASKNVHYLGCPWDLIFTDAEDEKGFHIFDTETGELEFVGNPYKMYHKYVYNDAGVTDVADVMLTEDDYKLIRNTFVKVFVRSKNSPVFLDRFLDRISECGPAQLTVVEETVTLDTTAAEVSISEDTITVLRKSINDYSDLLPSEDKKEQVGKFLEELYVEAIKL